MKAEANSDDGRLRQRYEKLITEFELLEQTTGKRTATLHKLLERLSSLLLGADQGFDSALENLLASLKKDASGGHQQGQHIPVQIDALSLKITELSDHRASRTKAASETLIELLESVAEHSKDKQQIKKIKKQIAQLRKEKNRLQSFDQFPIGQWLNTLAAYQGSIDPPADSQNAATGLFSKLFKGSQSTSGDSLDDSCDDNEQRESLSAKGSAAAQGVADSGADEKVDNALTSNEADLAVVEGDTDKAIDPHRSDVTPITKVPDLASDRLDGEVIAVLLSLLADIEVPEQSKATAASLYDRLQQPVLRSELVSVLDDIAEVVTAALRRDQRDFEDFLQQLESKLVALNAFFLQFFSHVDGFEQNRVALVESIDRDVSQLRGSVNSSQSLSELKHKVAERLDGVTSALRAFDDAQKHRIDALTQEMQVMQVQIDSLETESADAKIQLAVQREKLMRDSLTGLPNREAYDLRFADEFSRWARYRRPLTLVMADIDLFKSINDNYGHAAGDKVLALVAKIMRNQLRESDFVARYGGEEFAFIMPETAAQQASLAAEKVRSAVEASPFNFKQSPLTITCSFGLTCFKDGDDCEAVFERADAALYRAKDNGRNRVEVA